MIYPVRNARGLTLVEFTIVSALGAIVILTITGFYLASQSMWLDSSIQAMSQREATLFLGEIEKRVEASDHAVVQDPNQLLLYFNSTPMASVAWKPGEERAEITDFLASGDKVTTWPANGKIMSLKFHSDGPDPRVVYLDSLRIQTSAGEMIYLSSAFGVLNHP